MQAFAWLMVASSVFLVLATIFFIYALGLAILTFTFKMLLIAILLFGLALLMQLILSIIND